MGGWTLHVPVQGSVGVSSTSEAVYCAFQNGVLEYDLATSEKTMLSSIDFLSDIDISAIGKTTDDKAVFIGYQNGNIDKIQNGNITNIPAIRLAQIQGVKRVNRIVPYGEYVYVATGFGVVKLDPKKNEVRETYYPTPNNLSIRDLGFYKDSLFVSIGNSILKCLATNPAIGDESQWELVSRIPVLDSLTYNDIEVVNGQLFITKISPNYGKDSIFLVEDGNLKFINDDVFDFEIQSIANFQGKLSANIQGSVLIYNDDQSGYDRSYYLVQDDEFLGAQESIVVGTDFYVADMRLGLVQFKPEQRGQILKFVGPPQNKFYRMDWGKGGLLVAGGGLNGQARTFNNTGVYRYKDNWSVMNIFNQPAWDTTTIYDYLCVASHPTEERFAIGTYSLAPLTIVGPNNNIEKVFDNNNSPIELGSLGNGDAVVTSALYDNIGNLHVLNGYSDKILKTYTKDGEWIEFDLGSNSRNKLTDKLVIDYNGHLWMSVPDQGVFAYNFNGTLDNPGDDKTKQFTTSENGGALPANTVTALAVDFDNEIWVGTENGFAIIYNSANTFDAAAGDYNAQRIKLEFEGNVEFLLGSTYISDIEIDGGNRKWIGTAGSGIFCLSADGLTILKNYTVENSPLISNNILDMEIDQETGEMYIITDKGLVSHRIDASYEDPEYENVKVFPNPVRPEFNGDITIQGIRYNSDVKITDLGGNLVYQTTSNGGTSTWNGRRITGEKVASGVYLIWTAANEGQGRQVGKVTIINY
jgi:hypothetical protein